jgi:hypothetical protein
MRAQAIHLRIGRISADSSQRAALRDGALAQSIEAALLRSLAGPSGHGGSGSQSNSQNSLASVIAASIAARLSADGMVPGIAQPRKSAQRGGGHE